MDLNNYDKSKLISFLNDTKLFTKKQVSNLLELKFQDGDNMLYYIDSNNIDIDNNEMLDYINLYIDYDFNKLYEKTKNELENKETNYISDIIFSLNIFKKAEYKLQKEIDKNRNITDVDEGIYVCPNCSSKRTYATSGQTTSADEASTIFITCANTSCRHKWSFTG